MVLTIQTDYNIIVRMLEKVGKNFKIVGKIDEGAFGEVYQGINIKTGLRVAVKAQTLKQDPTVFYQCKIYNLLQNDHSVLFKGVPNIYYCYQQGQFNVLVMDLMGPSLETLFYQNNCKFSLKTVLMLVDQMISRIQYVHSRGFIHRDIKPGNFCMGFGKTSLKVYMIDFGLAKRCISKNGKHIPYSESGYFIGTTQYASTNVHLGYEPSRRDDMESIGYTCMQFLRGSLPWSKFETTNKQLKRELVKEKKMSTSIQQFCEGFPVQFVQYFKMCRKLQFDEKPQYSNIKNMFQELFKRKGYEYDYQYDWVEREKKKKTEIKKKQDKGNVEQKAQEKAQDKAQEKAQEKAQDKAQDKAQEKAQDKAQDKAQEKAQGTPQIKVGKEDSAQKGCHQFSND